MFGYVRPAVDKLDTTEINRFRSVYCGLCHTLKQQYGFAARFLLNYDFAFLVILLSQESGLSCDKQKCIVHPIGGCVAVKTEEALVKAARYSVILSWWQIQDHIADHSFLSGIKYRLAARLLRNAYYKAKMSDTAFDSAVQTQLKKLSQLEDKHCGSLDEASEPFAILMQTMAQGVENEQQRRILEQVFYQLGRWIYLVDAADDYEKDVKEDNYNPLRYYYDVPEARLSDAQKGKLAKTLDHSVAYMASAYALWDYGVWTPILDSIFYESFYAIGTAVLKGTYHKIFHQRKNRHKRTQYE